MSLTRERGRLTLIGIAIALLILSSIAILSYRTLSTLERQAVAVAHTQELLVTLEEAVSTMKDAALAQRSYLLTGEERYRTGTMASAAQAKALLQALSRLAEEADQKNGISELVLAGTTVLSDIERDPAQRLDTGSEAARNAMLRTNEKLDSMRGMYRRIKATQELSLLESRADATASAQRASHVLVIGGTVGLVMLLLVFALLKRQIRQRVDAEATAHEREHEIRFIHETIIAIGNSADARSALATLLDTVRAFTGWVYGQAWLPDAGDERMTMAVASPRDGGQYADFKAQNEDLHCVEGQGLIGAVWLSRKSAWRSDMGPGPGQFRRPIILAAGFKTWMAFPVTSEDRVPAVIEFFDRRKRAPDERLLRLISILAGQLGPFIERQQGAEKIEALNADLTRYAAQLDVSNKELESFAYSVSHDLRSPLRAIDGYSRMLEEDYGDGLDAEAVRRLKVVRANTGKMNRLIDDLLAFSRLGKKSIVRQPIDMAQSARDAYATVQEPDSAVEIELAPLPMAHGDAALIAQVWANLLSNAVKYSSTRPEPRITVFASDLANETLYCVKDNGVGFDMNYYGKLFGVFQRLHAEDEFPGTGVGLAIVQRIVTRHGGRVWAHSKPDEGATFCFTLPKEHAHVRA
ncbi:MAG TPA: ATP-binding protein [Burkholderiales bacterium]